MNARNLKPVFAAAVFAMALGAGQAHAQDIYATGSIGTPHYGNGGNSNSTGSGFDGVGGEGNGLSGKVAGGYQITSNFAVEGGLAALGHINDASGKLNSHGVYLDAVGALPLGGHVSLLGSVGVAHVNVNTSYGDDKGSGLKLGLGAEYAVSRQVSLRGEYENYRVSEFGARPSIGQYTVGLKVGF